MATFEDASKCPKCQEKGREGTTKHLLPPAGKLVQMICDNSRCKWFNTPWTVQVRSDGTIPDPDTKPRGGRVFVPTDDQVEAITRYAQSTLDQSLRPGGGEIQR